MDSITINRIPENLTDKIIGTLINVGNFKKGSYFIKGDNYIFLTYLKTLNALAVSIQEKDLEFAKNNPFKLVMDENTEVVNLSLNKMEVDEKDILETIEKLNPVVGIFGKNENMLDVFSKVSQRIENRGYSSLVGMGLGLTPSGDDFLAGILAYEHAKGTKIINEKIKLENTNHISGEFLKYAQSGIFSEDIIKLFNEDVNYANDILQKGHTSGGDSLFGIYYAIKMEDIK